MQASRPIPFNIPFDVWTSIIRCLDFQTLQTFTLLSRDFKHEAEKHLWASCTLHAPAQPLYDAFWTRAHIEEGCSVLLRASRASRLRSLSLDIQSSLGIEGDPEFERVLGLLTHVLLTARRLQSLTIKALHHRNRLATALSAHAQSFSFSLSKLRTDLFIAPPLYPFIAAARPSLTSIELFSVSFAPAGQAPAVLHPLTALTTVRVHQAVQTSVICGAPVRSLELLGVWEGECALVAENIDQVGKMTEGMMSVPTRMLLGRAEMAEFGLDHGEGAEEEVVATAKTLQAWAHDAYHNANAPVVPASPSLSYGSHRSQYAHVPVPRTRSRSRSQSQTQPSSSSASPHRPSLPPPSIPAPLVLGPALLSLRITLHDHPTTSHAYTSLLAHLPHLRLLSLTHSDITDLTHRRRALSVLGALSSLEVFEWSGGAGREGAQADVFDCVSKRCKRLRRIVFRWGGREVGEAGGEGEERGRSVSGSGRGRGSDGSWFERRFERCGGEGVWGIVQSC